MAKAIFLCCVVCCLIHLLCNLYSVVRQYRNKIQKCYSQAQAVSVKKVVNNNRCLFSGGTIMGVVRKNYNRSIHQVQERFITETGK